MKEIILKSLEDMNMYDPPLMGIFEYNKAYTAYSIKVLAGIDVDNIDEMHVNYRHPKGCQLPGFVENCFQHY